MRLDYDFEDFQFIIKEWKNHFYSQKEKEKCFDSIIAWVKYDETNRKSLLPNLLESIPLKDLSYEFMKNNVRSEAIIQVSSICCIQIMSALTHSADMLLRQKEQDIYTKDISIKILKVKKEQIRETLQSEISSMKTNFENEISSTTKRYESQISSMKASISSVMNDFNSLINSLQRNRHYDGRNIIEFLTFQKNSLFHLL